MEKCTILKEINISCKNRTETSEKYVGGQQSKGDIK